MSKTNWVFGKEYSTEHDGEKLWKELELISNGADPYEYGLNNNWFCRIVHIRNRDYLFSKANDEYIDKFNFLEYSEIIKIYNNLYHQAKSSVPNKNSTVNIYNGSSKTPRLLVHLLCKEINNTNLLKAHENFPTVVGNSGKLYTISIDDNDKIFVENLEYSNYTVILSLSDSLKEYLSKNKVFFNVNGNLKEISNNEINKLYNYESSEYNNVQILLDDANEKLLYISNLFDSNGLPIVNSIFDAKYSTLTRPNLSVDDDIFKKDVEGFSFKKNKFVDSVLANSYKGSIALSRGGNLILLLPTSDVLSDVETSHVKSTHVRFKISPDGFFYDIKPIPSVVQISKPESQYNSNNIQSQSSTNQTQQHTNQNSSFTHINDNTKILENNVDEWKRKIIGLMGLPCDD